MTAARNLAVDDRHVDGEGAAPDRAAADLGGRPPTAPPGPTLMNAFVEWLERLLVRAFFAVLLWVSGAPDQPWSAEL